MNFISLCFCNYVQQFRNVFKEPNRLNFVPSWNTHELMIKKEVRSLFEKMSYISIWLIIWWVQHWFSAKKNPLISLYMNCMLWCRQSGIWKMVFSSLTAADCLYSFSCCQRIFLFPDKKALKSFNYFEDSCKRIYSNMTVFFPEKSCTFFFQSHFPDVTNKMSSKTLSTK